MRARVQAHAHHLQATPFRRGYVHVTRYHNRNPISAATQGFA